MLWVLPLLLNPSQAAGLVEEGGDLDRAGLNTVEDYSESLANALIELSVAARDGNLEKIARFFPGQIRATRWPLEPIEEHEVRDWLSSGECDQGPEAVQVIGAAEMAENWKSFLARFSEIEDTRFKVKDAVFTGGERPGTENAAVKFFLVGRNLDGHRWWVKGTGHLSASRSPNGQWEISDWRLEHIASTTATRDLFSEISYPAGLSLALPPYGSPGNDDFIYHGGAAADFDQDGFVDLVVTGISRIYLYRNMGNGRFEDIGQQVGLPKMPNATAPLAIDYDNDGDQDLFFSASGQQMLFQNQLGSTGSLRFLDYSVESGVDRAAVGFSAALGDVNADGWPDIYVCSYNRYGQVLPNSWHRATNGTPNLLFINQADGTFKEMAAAYGVNDSRWSYAAQFADLNGDGRQDLYVANDYGENALYINVGDRFEEHAAQSHVLDPGNGMGVSLGEFNNDGRLDLFVTNMSSTAGNRILDRLFPGTTAGDSVLRKLAAGSSIFEGRGDGTFVERTGPIGTFTTGWAWGGIFTDFDNDGWQDVYSTSGFISGKSMKDT